MGYKDFINKDKAATKNGGLSYKSFIHKDEAYNTWEENRAKKRDQNFTKLNDEWVQKKSKGPNSAMLNRVTPEDKKFIDSLPPAKSLYEKTLKPTVDILKSSGQGLLTMLDRPRNAVSSALKESEMFYRPTNTKQLTPEEANNLMVVNGKVVGVKDKSKVQHEEKNLNTYLNKAKDIGKAALNGLDKNSNVSALEGFMRPKEIEQLKQRAPIAAAVGEIGANVASDPLTYLPGGFAGKGEQLLKVEKQMRNAAELGQKIVNSEKLVNPLINGFEQVGNLVNKGEAVDTSKYFKPEVKPNVINLNATGQPTQLMLPAPAKKEFKQVSYAVKKNPKGTTKWVDTEIGKIPVKTKTVGEPIVNSKVINAKNKKATLLNENYIERPFVTTPGEVKKPKIDKNLLGGAVNIKNAPKIIGESEIPKLIKKALPPPQSKFVSSAKKEPFSFKETYNKFYTRFVDANSPIKPVSEKGYIKATNSKNVGGTVDFILKEGLVDTKGNKIGESLQKTVEQIPKGKENTFWEYMSQRHNIDRAREGKPVQANYTPEMSTEAVKRLEAQHPEFKKIGDNVTGWIDKFNRAWGVDTGIIEKEVYENLRNTYKSYFPTQRDFSTIEKTIPNSASRKFVDQSSTIRKATGSERDIINPVENIMNLVNRTVRTSKSNEVGKTILDEVRKSPEKLKQFAEIIPGNEGMFANTDNVVSVLENGKPIYLKINNKPLLDSLNNINVAKTGDVERIAKSVTNVFKQLITQKNPVFAVRNIARDVPTAYVFGSEKNPLKFGKDLLSASKDLVTNAESAQKYRAVGGGGSNFFNSGNVAKSAEQLTKNPNILKRIGGGIEKFNNLTESAPRLAEFKRTLAKTGDTDKALYAANDVTTNFSRGGDITKSLDAFVPYLNAGVQGLDKLARSIDPRNPKQALSTLIKGGIGITAPTVFFHYLNQDNPNYQMLDDRTKDNYFLIPNGDTFIKIPKSRELGVLFGSLFERLMRKSEGDTETFKGFGNTVKTNFSPANPIEDNILSPYLNLRRNKDFADRTIVPMSMQNLSPKYQYDEKTTEIAKTIGDKFNISPKQIDYIIKSYTGVIGQLGLPAATKSNYNGNTLQNLAKPVTSQFTADPAYSNNIMNDFYDKLNKLQVSANDKDFVSGVSGKADLKQKTPEENQASVMNKYKKQIDEINKKIKETNDDGEKRKLRLQMLEIAQKALAG